jgi:maltooligosyltrehalose trehalohydrolase
MSAAGAAFGARCLGPGGRDGVAFSLWAPGATSVEVQVERPDGTRAIHGLVAGPNDIFTVSAPEVRAGDSYQLRRDEGPWWPDPASRSQPGGVHGASVVIDPDAFPWTDGAWRGPAERRQAVYELHVGTFTTAGTFEGVRDGLPYLADLGITTVELMPVAAFPGRWNWGYDGAALFSPSERYGTPDDLRALVDRAHALGLAVLLDVVYNHLGPDGAYLAAFAPTVFRDDVSSAWGRALDLREGSGTTLRSFFIDNAIHWLREYHFDGLRLDAIHAIVDDGGETFVAELTSRARVAVPDRRILVIAEDDRNLNTIVRPRAEGGWGLDGVWADDFHHQVHRRLTNEEDGYYRDYDGSAGAIADTMAQGWYYTGQKTPRGRAQGTDPAGIPLDRFVIALQNHDQIGNRALGERLHHLADLHAVLAATALLLLSAETPLLFMGQEWAATSPFLFFTDHAEPLASQVVAGRLREHAAFAAAHASEAIPSPQAATTHDASVLRWRERDDAPHAAVLKFTRQLLHLRRQLVTAELTRVIAIDEGALALVHTHISGDPASCLLVRLSGGGEVAIDVTKAAPNANPPRTPMRWVPMWSSREVVVGGDAGTFVRVREQRLSAVFPGPGAVMFGTRREEGCG